MRWLLLLHLLAAMVWLGGLVSVAGFGLHTLRSGTAEAVTRLAAALRTVGPSVLAPASALVLVSGVWMVAASDEATFGQTWVWLSLVLLASAVGFGALVVSRTAVAAERAAGSGDRVTAARHLRGWLLGIATIVLLLVAATVDMVFRPGGAG